MDGKYLKIDLKLLIQCKKTLRGRSQNFPLLILPKFRGDTHPTNPYANDIMPECYKNQILSVFLPGTKNAVGG